MACGVALAWCVVRREPSMAVWERRQWRGQAVAWAQRASSRVRAAGWLTSFTTDATTGARGPVAATAGIVGTALLR